MALNHITSKLPIAQLREMYSPKYFNKQTPGVQASMLQALQDPVTFCKAILNYEPFPYQEDLLRDQQKRILILKGRQTGGSKTLSAKIVYDAFWNPGAVFAIVAPSQRQASLLFKSIMDWFNNHPWLQAELNQKGARYTQTQITLGNNATIYSLPSGRDGRTIRGIAIPKGYIAYDEAAMIPDKAYDAMDFANATGGGEILNSTPLGEDGHFYRMYTHSSLQNSSSPVYNGYHWPSSINPLITPEYIEEKRATKSKAAFEQEIMGNFVAGYGKWFDRLAIQECIDHDLEQMQIGDRSKQYVYGIDLGIEGDPTVVTVCEVVGTKKLIVRHIAAFLKNPQTHDYTHIDSYDDVVEYVADLHHMRGFTALQVNVDASNQSYVSTMLEKRGLPVKPIKWGSNAANGSSMKLDLMSTLQTAFRNKQVIIPNEPNIIRQLHNYSYTITENKNYKFTAKDEDFIDSLAMSVYTILGDAIGSDNFYVGSGKAY